MKKLIFILLAGLFSCKNNSVTISTEEYRKLKDDVTLKNYPKVVIWYDEYGDVQKSHVVMIDGHEMIIGVLRKKHNYSSYIIHRPNCIECKKRDTLLNTH